MRDSTAKNSKNSKGIVPASSKLAYEKSVWHLSSSFQDCMDEISRRINGGTIATVATAEVVGATLSMLQLSDGSGDTPSPTPQDDLFTDMGNKTGHSLPSLGVNYLLTEINDILYDMARKRDQYEGSAYNYTTAIDATAIFVGISKAEDRMKEKRKTLVKARLQIPETIEGPRLRVMNPGPYRWLFLNRPSNVTSGPTLTNIWCIRPSLKKRATDFAIDFGIPYGTLAEMLMVIAWEDFTLLDPYYLVKLEKETKNIWRYLENFRPEEDEPQ